ncbi:outer membrane beta-barrel family protein [Flavivirga jejuensis]|uniref:Outer membrane beta-barrel family protein n=1 Tax=Flavivirga jejuensis TaxID=870487 RepID=A0ABT8WKM5_9FLAO|nr:outer membrane beta-barrel family protein [Flavivirga jejuensis]MDO5973712.1 outer membrane beta-barrel family protein [Flavivirga jejuensis]
MSITYKGFFIISLLLIQQAHTQINPDSFESNKNIIIVRSKILDTKNAYIPYANIVFINLKTEDKAGVISNEDDGVFSIELIPGEYIVQISVLGYSKYTKNYHFFKDTVLKDIVLQEQNEQLDEVIIKGDISKNIKHSATSMTINIQNDTLYKKISAADILPLLPGVQIDQEGSVTLEGEPVTFLMNGKRQRMSSDILMMLLESIQGDGLKSVELINTPSAKYSGRIKKVIDINLKKQREDGIVGSVSTRVNNADFSIMPLISINYKTGKFVFTVSSMPYFYSKRTTSFFTNRQLLDNSLSFDDEQENLRKSTNSFNEFGVDYTINKKHSVSVGISLDNGNNESGIDYITNQFAFEALTNQQFTTNANKTHNDGYTLDFGYRYDIGEQGARLDFASSYGENTLDSDLLNENELIDVSDDTTVYENNRDGQNQKNKQFSSRLDYVLSLKDKKGKFESGIKYDDLSITDANIFESFNTDTNVYNIDTDFTNSFEYNEQVYTSYASFDSSHKKLKYSLGLRLEHVETQSFSETTNQTFNNTFSNILPVISLKYMTNEKQTSNISLSYRKGYNLPPYIQLNPFETFVNSNTIKRGNPELTQNIYHLLRLSHTINNKYFFTLNANFYTNLFQTTQILEDDITVISYQNLGKRSLYKASFSTTLNLYAWWRLNVNSMFNYSVLKSMSVDNSIFTWVTPTTNTFTLPNNYIINLSTYFSNGDSSGLDTPNSFLRVSTSISLSKRFFSNKLSTRIGISDIFGATNKNESSYIIDNTSYSSRVLIQNPRISFRASYNFSSGKKVNKKAKKSSAVDGSRF